MGPNGGPAAARPAGIFVDILPWVIFSVTPFLKDFSLAAALDMLYTTLNAENTLQENQI